MFWQKQTDQFWTSFVQIFAQLFDQFFWENFCQNLIIIYSGVQFFASKILLFLHKKLYFRVSNKNFTSFTQKNYFFYTNNFIFFTSKIFVRNWKNLKMWFPTLYQPLPINLTFFPKNLSENISPIFLQLEIFYFLYFDKQLVKV